MNRVLHRYRKEFKVTSKNQVWHTGERVQLGYSTADAVIQVVRVVVGGRSRLNIRERRRPAEDSAMALMISVDGPAGLDGPRAAVSPVHRPSSGK